MDVIPKQTFHNLDEQKKQRIIDASINEFAARSFTEANLSNIIKEAKIPRGSFYQYFEDKTDLYEFIFNYVGEKKMEYLDKDLFNRDDLPFLEIFRVLYRQGLAFALAHPKYMQIGKHALSLKGELFNKLIGDGLKLAKQYYIGYIENDKLKGRIRKDVDSDVFAEIVLQSTTNIAITEVQKENINLHNMEVRVNSLIDILQKGIE